MLSRNVRKKIKTSNLVSEMNGVTICACKYIWEHKLLIIIKPHYMYIIYTNIIIYLRIYTVQVQSQNPVYSSSGCMWNKEEKKEKRRRRRRSESSNETNSIVTSTPHHTFSFLAIGGERGVTELTTDRRQKLSNLEKVEALGLVEVIGSDDPVLPDQANRSQFGDFLRGLCHSAHVHTNKHTHTYV